MNELFTSASVVDLVIGLTLLEGLALAVYHHHTGRGVAVADFAPNMVSGLFLMLAVRAAVGDARWPWIALCLLTAGVVHGADLRRRWRR